MKHPNCSTWNIGRILKLFLPFEDGDGTGTSPPPPPPPAPGSGPGDRPDWCPEKFFDPDVGPRTEVGFKAFTELEGKLREGKDAFKAELDAEALAATPESYELKMPEDLQIPDDVEMTLTAEDPLVSAFFEFAKTEHMSQDTVNSLISMYVKSELAAMPVMKDEIGKLGDYGQDRLLKVQTWLSKSLDDAEMKVIGPMLTSAESIQALEKLMKISGPGSFDGDTTGEGLSLEELRSMQNDKKYWQEKDPAFIKKVELGYARLYKGNLET